MSLSAILEFVACFYFVIAFLLFVWLCYTASRLPAFKRVPHWWADALLDSFLWPYYVLRYGVEAFYKEIK